jgi:SWI/SNF-related matrix-associated actin-dependent regulator of chromatin subfamily A-like protein 1
VLGYFPLVLSEGVRKTVNAATRKIPGRRWDPRQGVWWIPNEQIFVAAAVIEPLLPSYAQRLRLSERFIEARAVANVGSDIVALSKAANSDLEIPSPEGCDYLPFQKAGIAYAVQPERDAVLLADEMGLGKTVQAIGIANYKGYKKILVICPASLKINWFRELHKWLIPTKKIFIVSSQTPEHFLDYNDVVIVNYDILKKWQPLLAKHIWEYVIVDEAQYVKNPDAERSKHTTELSDAATEYRTFITGTPICNKPKELWNIIFTLDPKNWNDWWWYARRYCDGQRDRSGKWNYEGASNLPELQRKLRETLMVRRRKVDVLKDLPPKFRQLVEISPVGPKYKKVIEAERAVQEEFDKALSLVEQAALNGAKKSLDEAIARANDAKAVVTEEAENAFRDAVKHLNKTTFGAFGHIARIRHMTAMAKVDDVIEFTKNVLENVEKVVLFAHHHDVIDALMAAFGKYAVCVRGGMNSAVRQESVDRFQDDPRVRVFIGGLYAAGVGLTLTAAHTVIFAELDWVPGIIAQAEDRCHRIGQFDNVTVYHIVLENSLDCKLAQTIVQKLEVIEQALDR